jgi:hypothetical protein
VLILVKGTLTVSVIDAKRNTKIGNDIPVAAVETSHGRLAIPVYGRTGTIYVANRNDGTYHLHISDRHYGC